ncbi:MAG: hypothetical protein QF903_04085 [Planctomycetota bacterium]|jgi:hypothetical protein|nr:hypothetical protein [Planctomycetota bacterium]MDP6988637.1 hypothetical protein [Planctomycetota bacterium]
MSRLGRHLVGDVLHQTAAAVAVVTVLSVAASAFRHAHELGSSPPGRIAVKVVEAAANHLLVCWPLACALGFTGALALWVGRRQHTMVACAGLPLPRVSGGALAATLALLGAGDAVGMVWTDAEAPGRVTWESGDAWGAALRRGEGEWRWVEFRPDPAGPRVREGRVASLEELAATVAFTPPETPVLPGLCSHALFVLLMAALALCAVQWSARWMGALSYGGPLLGWLGWTRLSNALATLAGAGPEAEVLGGVLAAAAEGALGVLVLYAARPR